MKGYIWKAGDQWQYAIWSKPLSDETPPPRRIAMGCASSWTGAVHGLWVRWVEMGGHHA